MNEVCTQFFKSKYGEFIIGSINDHLCLLDFRYRKMRTTVDNRLKKGLNAKFVESDSKVINQTKLQLQEYFHQQRRSFDIPLLTVGTDFQKKVWKALMRVRYGKTSTYLELSKQVNNEKAVRAVASANGANAIAIIIPCHRIIGTNGELVGYAGGLPTKKKLLDLEQDLFA